MKMETIILYRVMLGLYYRVICGSIYSGDTRSLAYSSYLESQVLGVCLSATFKLDV